MVILVSWGLSTRRRRRPVGKRCSDCGARPGRLHRLGCDAEVCPVCRGQLLSCGHMRRVARSRRRIPHLNVPVRCSMCGRANPAQFMVSDREWKKFVPPHLQNIGSGVSGVLCRSCYNRFKRMFPHGWAKARGTGRYKGARASTREKQARAFTKKWG